MLGDPPKVVKKLKSWGNPRFPFTVLGDPPKVGKTSKVGEILVFPLQSWGGPPQVIEDQKSVVWGNRVFLGGRGIIKKKMTQNNASW